MSTFSLFGKMVVVLLGEGDRVGDGDVRLIRWR